MMFFISIISLTFIIAIVSTISLIDITAPSVFPQVLVSCQIGSQIVNDCHECICSQYYYMCSPKPCKRPKHPISWEVPSCKANTTYVENLSLCICDYRGLWPNEHCYDVFGYLPEKNLIKLQCEPDSYVIVECNVCRCNSEGTIDGTKCTKNDCRNTTEGVDGDLMKMPTYNEEVRDSVRIELSSSKTGVVKKHHRFSRRKAPTHGEEECTIFNLTASSEFVPQYKCSAGSTYIIRCKQCICPYMGSIRAFCRPLPKNFYCEQGYPYVNYKNYFARRNFTNSGITSVLHMHTKYPCTKSGPIEDKCFKCECQDNDHYIVREHCFRKETEECKNGEPTFINDYNIMAQTVQEADFQPKAQVHPHPKPMLQSKTSLETLPQASP